MSADRDEILARIQRAADTPGSTLEEVDRNVAEELGVDFEAYLAYLAVAETIDQHGAIRMPGQLGLPVVGEQRRGPLHRVEDLAAAIGWLASSIYQGAVQDAPRRDLAHHAARILGSLLQLRQNLRDLDTLERLADAVGVAQRGDGVSRDA